MHAIPSVLQATVHIISKTKWRPEYNMGCTERQDDDPSPSPDRQPLSDSEDSDCEADEDGWASGRRLSRDSSACTTPEELSPEDEPGMFTFANTSSWRDTWKAAGYRGRSLAGHPATSYFPHTGLSSRRRPPSPSFSPRRSRTSEPSGPPSPAVYTEEEPVMTRRTARIETARTRRTSSPPPSSPPDPVPAPMALAFQEAQRARQSSSPWTASPDSDRADQMTETLDTNVSVPAAITNDGDGDAIAVFADGAGSDVGEREDRDQCSNWQSGRQ